jgi:hypothetical protein
VLRNLRKQWGEISLEKKLAMFVGPVFAAVVSGVLLAVILGLFGDDENSPPVAAKRSSALEVLDLAVAGGERPELIGDPRAPQLIDVTVRNAGEVVSVVTDAAFQVRDFGLVRICEAGGGLEPTEEYDVTLPPIPQNGDVVKAKVSQQIPANEADRFTFRLNVPFRAMQDGMRLYQLDVELLHDAATAPLKAGTVVVSVPFLPEPEDFPDIQDPALYSPEVLACYEENEKILRRFLALEGERSPELNEKLLP